MTATVDPLLDVERRLSAQLRALPEGRVRDELVRTIDALLDFAADCRCTDAQGDGVPCGSVLTACEGCPECAAILSELRERVPR